VRLYVPDERARALLKVLEYGIREYKTRHSVDPLQVKWICELVDSLTAMSEEVSSSEVKSPTSFNPVELKLEDDEPTLTVREVSEICDLSVQYVGRLCRQHKLRWRKEDGRYLIASRDVFAYREQRQNERSSTSEPRS
jgi:hypothetical protein